MTDTDGGTEGKEDLPNLGVQRWLRRGGGICSESSRTIMWFANQSGKGLWAEERTHKAISGDLRQLSSCLSLTWLRLWIESGHVHSLQEIPSWSAEIVLVLQ